MSNAFGFELWRRLGDGNLVISPASIADRTSGDVVFLGRVVDPC